MNYLMVIALILLIKKNPNIISSNNIYSTQFSESKYKNPSYA